MVKFFVVRKQSQYKDNQLNTINNNVQIKHIYKYVSWCQQYIFKNTCVSLVSVFSTVHSNEMKHCNKDMYNIYF